MTLNPHKNLDTVKNNLLPALAIRSFDRAKSHRETLLQLISLSFGTG